MRSVVVLLDCDGVLADFTGAYLDLVYEFTGERFAHADVTHFKIADAAFFKDVSTRHPNLRFSIDQHITQSPTFCRNLAVLPGSQAAVERIRKTGARVYCVTSPWHSSPYWQYERTKWLSEHFGFKPSEVVSTNDKRIVAGDILVDDKLDNLTDWHHGLPLLWDAPYNQYPTHIARVTDWEQVHRYVEACDDCFDLMKKGMKVTCGDH